MGLTLDDDAAVADGMIGGDTGAVRGAGTP
jgi:hypothetical protein